VDTGPLSALPYADTPLTAFGEQMTDVLLAAAIGEPLPQLPLPTAGPFVSTAPEVSYPDSGERPVGELTVLGFGMEVDFILKIGDPEPDAPPGTQDGSFRTSFYLSSTGLRLLDFRCEEMSREAGLPAPPALSGLETFGQDIIARIRSDTIAQLFMGEPERRIIDNAEVWEEVDRGRPDSSDIQRARVMLEQLGPTPPLSFDVGDGGILVRDETGRVFVVNFDLESDGQQFVLVTDPFVRIESLDP
jgi:hypothetical protein